MRSCNTQHQARCGNDAIVRAQYRGAEPADAFSSVSLQMTWTHIKFLDVIQPTPPNNTAIPGSRKRARQGQQALTG
jgi:hypothetical protein